MFKYLKKRAKKEVCDERSELCDVIYILPSDLPWNFSFGSAAAHFLAVAGLLESEPPCPRFLHCCTKKTTVY